MKTFFRLGLTFLLVSAFFSCADDNITDIGRGIMPASDKISVGAEIFAVTTENYFVSGMFTRQDSFLLGTFFDIKYGTTHADILAQVENPEGHSFPSNMIADSVVFVMYYNNFFGDRHSPMQVSVFEMNKATFNFMTPYPSNLNPFDFTDKSLLLGQKTFSAVDASKRNDSTFVSMKLSNEFLQRFTTLATRKYTNADPFVNHFRGLFITPEFGSSLMLFVRRIDLEFHYHYTYQHKGTFGQDSTFKVNSVITFPANARVRQVNRFVHPDSNMVRNRLTSMNNQIHYVASPAKVYTRVKLPLRDMHEKMQTSQRIAIHNAKLRVDVIESANDTITQPRVSNMLLIRESEYATFFRNRSLPNNTTAVLGTLTAERNSETNATDRFYSFDVANLLASEFKRADNNSANLTNSESFLLVPVNIRLNTANTITEVSEQFLMNAVTIGGSNHPTKPMRIHLVYSRF